MSLPSGWLDYTPIGKQIRGTRFICFKVPLTLDEQQLSDIPLSDQLTPDQLIKRVRNLGLIIDLTDTRKYYSPFVFKQQKIEYAKIQIEGKLLPKQHQHDEFANIVSSFLSQKANTKKLIGVHCTHGCNRTGLLVCTFLVEHCGFSPSEALAEFSSARGHPIERLNYVNSIKKRVAVKRMQSDVTAMTPAIASNNWRQSLNFRLNQSDKTRTRSIKSGNSGFINRIRNTRHW